MTLTEKILLVLSVLFSWLLVWFSQWLLETPQQLSVALLQTAGVLLLWMTPLALLTLFGRKVWYPLLAFMLGIGAFLVIAQTMYMLFGIVLFALGFVYWFMNVQYARKTETEFSAWNIFSGIGLFFTILAAFGGLVYYSSPLRTQQWENPQVPEAFFDAVYTPVSSVLLGALPNIPEYERPTPEQIKPEIYEIVNLGITQAVNNYQGYVPFAFAGGIFFLLRALLFPLSYLLFAIVYMVIQLFLRLGWLQKQTIQVPKEVVSF